MEAIAFAVGLFGALNTSVRILIDLKTHFESLREIQEPCEKLKAHLTAIKNRLEPVQRSPEDLPEESREYLRDAEGQLKHTEEKLKKLLQSVESSSCSKISLLRRFCKAKKWAQELDTLLSRTDVLYERIMHLSLMKGVVQRMKEAGGGATDEEFKPTYAVKKNPERVVLNFDDTNTPEGRLKDIILNEQAGIMGAVSTGEGSGSASAAVGMGGVGKSCCLRGIAHREEVRRHFSGGIYWIPLGEGATAGSVVEHIAEAMDNSGGSERARKIQGTAKVTTAVNKAASWFGGHRCLFLLDDLWCTKSDSWGYFFELKNLINLGSGSRILFSTRDERIAQLAGKEGTVRFSARETDEAKQILCRCAEFDPGFLESGDAEIREAFIFVLERCSGLPIALSIAGSAVAVFAQYMEPRSGAWKSYSEYEHFTNDLIQSNTEGHGGLSFALLTSLKLAHEQITKVLRRESLSAHEMYRALCVLRKQGWAPTSMLARLWKVGGEGTAEKVVREFRRLNLVELSYRKYDGKQLVGIELHDLVHDFCLLQAKEKESVEGWHSSMLAEYAPVQSKNGEGSETVDEVREWWSEDVADDNYIHQNVARHLIECKKLNELQGLLLDFRWTVRQLEISGLLSLENDFKLFSENIRHVDELKDREADCCEALRMISGAVRLSWGAVERSGLNLRQDLGFQMYSRLFNVRSRMEFVRRYLESLERNVEKPWAKVAWQCHETPGRRLLSSVLMEGMITAVALVPKTENAVVAFANGIVRIVEVGTGDTVRDFRGHDSHVTSVAISGNGEYIASGFEDKTLRIWETGTGTCLGQPLKGHTDKVTSVAISHDGKHIVSGSEDKTLRIWNRETGKCVGEPLVGHTHWVTSVAISHDGKYIVSGSEDSTLRIWDTETRKCVEELLGGRSSGVASVGISHNSKYIISGSRDGTLRIWDAEARECLGEPLQGHMDGLTTVAVSHDGKYIVSGSEDDTLRIWHTETGRCVGEPLREECVWVTSLAISHDDKYFVSGSGDGSLRVWDMERGKCFGEPRHMQSDRMTSVVVRNDSKHVVSKSQDETLCMWNAQTGSCVEQPFRVRHGVVTAIAISDDGKYIISGYKTGVLRIWDRETGRCIGEPLQGHSVWVTSVAISHDSKHIVSGSSDKTLQIWDIKEGKRVRKLLRGHTDWITSVAISHDDRRVVSGSNDKELRIWDIETGKSIGEPLRGHTDRVTSVAIRSDDKYIASGSHDDTVRIWDFRTGHCVRTIKDPDSQELKSTLLLTRAFGRCAGCSALGEMFYPGHIFVEGEDRIILLRDHNGQISDDRVVLGTFDVHLTDWVFDSRRKQLWAALINGMIALVLITE